VLLDRRRKAAEETEFTKEAQGEGEREDSRWGTDEMGVGPLLVGSVVWW